MPLVLDLLRHGEALPAAEGGDDARRLSPRGERDLERLALHLAGLGWRPNNALTSPLRRARDTARIVLRHAAPDLVPSLVEALRPESDPAAVVQAMAEGGADQGHVVLIGHQPLLGELARWLTGGEATALAPGNLVRLEFTGEVARGAATSGWRIGSRDFA